MSGPDERNDSPDSTREEKFLLAEYQALIDIDSSRNERLDRFLTMFVTLAAAPWALYAITLKDNHSTSSLSTMPSPVAAAFVLIGILGFLVAMMFVQMRLTVILYTRSLNAIRGYFLDKDTQLSFRLPTDPMKPAYYEKGSYIQIAVAGMALVNSGYIGLGLYDLVRWPTCCTIRIWLCALLSVLSWMGHMIYYSRQARKRELKSKGAKELLWESSLVH